MQDATASYRPVYHFTDKHLLDRCIAAISRAALIEPFRISESLRNRHFRGFRAENASIQQLVAAYQKAIIEHHNGNLASALCALWVAQHEQIAAVALRALSITSGEPGNARSWIAAVQAKLTRDQHNVRPLVRTLAQEFADDDVRIFISIIGYDADQEQLRGSVDEELLQLSRDPYFMKLRLERDLESTQALLKTLEQSRTAIETEEATELKNAKAGLDSVQREHDTLASSLADQDAGVQFLTKQFAELKATLRNRQQALDATKTQTEHLAKAVDRQRKQLVATRTTYESRRKELEQRVQEQSNRITVLTTELQGIGQRIQAAEQQGMQERAEQQKWLEEQQRAQERQRLEEEKRAAEQKQAVSPLAAIPAAVAEPPKSILELVGNNAICYQGIQRTFRNTVVQFFRERLPRVYPTDHVQRIKKTFGQDWEKAAQNAAQSRQTLGTTTAIRDEYDLLGTNHFFGLFEAFYDKLFSLEAGQPKDRQKPVKARFLGNLKEIKDGRDPLSHPVEEEIPFDEAHHLLITAKQVLNWLGCEMQASELSALAAQLDGGQRETLSVLRRLPSEDSIYLEFVGRDSLLKDLATCFSNPDNKRCLLAGDGGKGKSAAAYRFAQSLAEAPGHFQLIVWLSAKRRKFREGVTATIDSPDFTTAEDAINRLLIEYGATAQDLEKPLRERKHLLFEYFNTFPAFIISDDIDTVLDDDEVVSLFTHEIPQTHSAVLLTSRRAIPGIRNFVVQGFDKLEGEQFIASRMQLYDLNPAQFSPAVIGEITKVTDSSPLYMDDLMRLMRIVDVKSAIRMWSEKTGDEARKYALQRELEQLTSDAKKVLIAAAVTDDPISFAELQSILEFSEDRLLSALNELQTLFVFPRAPVVEGEQRFQINLNTKKLVRIVEGQSDLYARIESVSKALAGKLPSVGQGIVSALIKQAHLRLTAGQTGEAESLLLKAIEKYPNAADLRGFLGYAYRRVGRIADARNQFEAACKLKGKSSEMFLHWVRMEISEKEWSRAIAVADRALKVLPDFYEIVERKVYALRQAGFDLYRGLHREKAAKLWADAVEEVKRRIKPPEALPPGERQLNASMYYAIVVCLDMLGGLRERNQWLERWEKEHPDDPQVTRQKEYIRGKRGTLGPGA